MILELSKMWRFSGKRVRHKEYLFAASGWYCSYRFLVVDSLERQHVLRKAPFSPSNVSALVGRETTWFFITSCGNDYVLPYFQFDSVKKRFWQRKLRRKLLFSFFAFSITNTISNWCIPLDARNAHGIISLLFIKC